MYRLPSTEAASSSATEQPPSPHTNAFLRPTSVLFHQSFSELIIGFESAG